MLVAIRMFLFCVACIAAIVGLYFVNDAFSDSEIITALIFLLQIGFAAAGSYVFLWLVKLVFVAVLGVTGNCFLYGRYKDEEADLPAVNTKVDPDAKVYRLFGLIPLWSSSNHGR